MTCENRVQIEKIICALLPKKGHRAQIGHRCFLGICAHVNACFYYLFYIKVIRLYIYKGIRYIYRKGVYIAHVGQNRALCNVSGGLAFICNLYPFATIAGKGGAA